MPVVMNVQRLRDHIAECAQIEFCQFENDMLISMPISPQAQSDLSSFEIELQKKVSIGAAATGNDEIEEGYGEIKHQLQVK